MLLGSTIFKASSEYILLLVTWGSAKLAQMPQALYRKWRPSRFVQVVGQEHVTRTLQNAVAAGRLGQAYLFAGPRGTGKTTLARLLAKAANCLDEDRSVRPCDMCQPCIAVNEGRFLDLIEIDAASNTGVDDVRDLRDRINFSPTEGRFKVYIIDEVHMLSAAAFNALLKTIEEPPSHAIFVLATTEEHKVPLTIKSRCQLFSFRLLTNQEIIGRLNFLAEEESLAIEPEAVAMIAQHGGGSLRDAESLLDQLIMAPGDEITLEGAQLILGTATSEAVETLTEACLEGDGPKGINVIHEALSSGTDARQFARQMVLYLRHLLLIKTAGQKLEDGFPKDAQDRMVALTQRSSRKQLIETLKRFNEAANTAAGIWQPQLPLELAFIELLPEKSETRPIPEKPSIKVIESPPPKVQKPEETNHEPEIPDVEPTSRREAAVAVEETAQPEPIRDETPAADVPLALISKNWSLLREEVGKVDPGLHKLLASCKPLASEGNIVFLGFDFPIIKEKFDRRKRSKETVSTILSELLDMNCRIETVITSDYASQGQPEQIDKEAFAALAQELGGIVREKE
jgi:DNA polymerase-3 subunit gamma/tau